MPTTDYCFAFDGLFIVVVVAGGLCGVIACLGVVFCGFDCWLCSCGFSGGRFDC